MRVALTLKARLRRAGRREKPMGEGSFNAKGKGAVLRNAEEGRASRRGGGGGGARAGVRGALIGEINACDCSQFVTGQSCP